MKVGWIERRWEGYKESGKDRRKVGRLKRRYEV